MAVLVFLGALAPLAGRAPSQIVSVHSELRPAVLSSSSCAPLSVWE